MTAYSGGGEETTVEVRVTATEKKKKKGSID
jgi:hypothetical protein